MTTDPRPPRRPDPLYRGPAPADWPASVAGPPGPSRRPGRLAVILRAVLAGWLAAILRAVLRREHWA